MYKVSLIIPIYNVAGCVAESLKSALEQTFEDIEYVLVDDCSKDDSLKIVKAVTNNHPRKNHINIFQHNSNSGVSTARNTGLKNATGEYIFFMDSDDKLSSTCIEKHYQAAKLSNSDFTVASHKIIGNRSVHKSNTIDLQKSNNEIIQSYLKKEWSFSSCNKLIKRDIILNNRLYFTDGIVHGEDILWTFKLAMCAKKMISISDTTYFYIIRNDSAISSSYSTRNITSLIKVFCQIAESLKWMQESTELRRVANAFITFHRFNIALFLTKNKEPIKVRYSLYSEINSSKLKNFDDNSVFSYLLIIPFPLFRLVTYLPYKIYKLIQ